MSVGKTFGTHLDDLDKIRTAYPIATKLDRCIFNDFFRKISNPFFLSRIFYLPYIRNGWSNWCETKRKWVNWMLCWLGYLWPWPLTLAVYLEFSRSNRIAEMRGTIVIQRKGRESIGRPDVKHDENKSTGCCADRGTFDLDLWPLIFKVKLYIGNGGTNGTVVDRTPWCETPRKWVD